MKQEEYRKIMEQIKPDLQTKEEIWEQLSLENKVNKKKRSALCWAAAALVACVSCFAVPVVAAELQSWILKINPEYNSVSEKIETGVYEKSDEHVRMSVEEMLSDEQNVYITVKYEALDDMGKEWLAEKDFTKQVGEQGLYIWPRTEAEDGGDYRVNWCHDCRELEELKTDTERWFYLYYNASSRDYALGEGKIVYPMTMGYETDYLDTTGNVDVYLYELEGETVPGGYFEPTCIQLSKLSFTIYAMQNGVYTITRGENYLSEKLLLSDEEAIEINSSIYLVMEDGTRVQLTDGSMTGTTPKAENGYSDLVLSSAPFERDEMAEIDPQKAVGVEIQGVYYEIKK